MAQSALLDMADWIASSPPLWQKNACAELAQRRHRAMV
jgi:hypothetical protein